MTEDCKAVFLSYAREDAAAARRIAEALRGFGVEVWFDQSELRGGDAWDEKIHGQIHTCTLFLAVISTHTQARREGYFRREWKLAVERTNDMAEGVSFLVPVVIDDTAESHALVPGEFVRVQWTRLPGGLPSPQFIEQVKRLLAQSSAEVGRISDPPHCETRTRSALASPRVGRALRARLGWVAAAAAVMILLGAFGWRRLNQNSDAVPPPEPAARRSAPPTSEKPAPLPTDKSIAVLPFDNLSTDKENGFFADGIHEDILTDLQNVRELRVVSRTSVMQYREKTKSIPQIARELGVAYILEGSVRRDGKRVRVSAQLIDARTDAHIWSPKPYDRELTDLFAIQSELAQAIASELKATLSPREKSLLERRPTEVVAAYDLYLQARDAHNRDRVGSSSLKKQEPLLLGAVAQDPKFAEAWGELARTHATIYFQNVEHTSARLASAKAAIDRATSLAPDSPEVIRNLGNYYFYGYRDYARASEQFEKLARMRPNDSDVLTSLGDIQQRRAQWLEALASFRKATQLDPGNIGYAWLLERLLHGGRRWDEAIAEQRRIVGMLPGNINEAWRLAYLHFKSRGSKREAEAFLSSLPPDEAISTRKLWATQSGDYAEAIRLNRQFPVEDRSPRQGTIISAAMTLAASGDAVDARALIADRPTALRSRLRTEPNNFDLWFALA